MREYICTICGYVYKTDGDLPDDFTCPLCGAGKDTFVLKETKEEPKSEEIKVEEVPSTENELSSM